ncbi:Hypothetical predicted protein [Olea europaea subsp. europaea]|uniref:Uncharacterized protein n=1 Tax=Olea europaea subsp. europaea TaxID=158383 RepID=A0A8S0PAS3_OLEEU|nr:Hypothetical predicted protein [Olea europaea subsp. europaea]
MEGPLLEEDDSDFNDSDNDISSGADDVLFEKNVTERVELNCDGRATIRQEKGHQAVLVHDEQPNIDDMEYPSSEELLSDVSSDDKVGYRFSEFMAETDMRDPKFEVGGPRWQMDCMSGTYVQEWHEGSLEPVETGRRATEEVRRHVSTCIILGACV